MQTVSPDVADVTTPDDVGDPACGFAAAGGALHVCTDRDGVVIDGDSDKACFAWARHQLRTARLCTNCDGGIGVERCTTCDGSGIELALTFESPDEQRDHLADTTTAFDDAGPDNVVYGFSTGNPAFHTHERTPELGMHYHRPGPAGHHHGPGDAERWTAPTDAVYADAAPVAS